MVTRAVLASGELRVAIGCVLGWALTSGTVQVMDTVMGQVFVFATTGTTIQFVPHRAQPPSTVPAFVRATEPAFEAIVHATLVTGGTFVKRRYPGAPIILAIGAVLLTPKTVFVAASMVLLGLRVK